MTATPQLSVVVPSVNGLGDLQGCLVALEREAHAVALEILVPERCGTEVREQVARRFPAVRVLPVEPGTSIPRMRRQAFQSAQADLVAVIEDHVVVPPGWAVAMIAAGAGGGVVGGSIVNGATARLVDWAAFVCEYSGMLRPAAPGPAMALTGNNTLYQRGDLMRFDEVLASECWEDRLHEAMRQGGIPLRSCPEIVAMHVKHYTIGEYVSQRFLYARAYAGLRYEGAAGVARLAAGVGAATVLPALLLGRIVRRAWARPDLRRRLGVALPLLGGFVMAWGLGEVAGYWFGRGDALGKVC